MELVKVLRVGVDGTDNNPADMEPLSYSTSNLVRRTGRVQAFVEASVLASGSVAELRFRRMPYNAPMGTKHQRSEANTQKGAKASVAKGGERKAWLTELETRFADAEETLGSRRRDLLRTILEHPEDTYFLSSRALAKHCEVDTATIVRTAQALGYERYADFAADLRAHFLSRITPYALMKSAARENRSIADHIDHGFELEMNNLQALRAGLVTDEVVKMAKMIERARRIMVVGVDFAAPLAQLLAYALVAVGLNAEAPIGSTGNLQQKVQLLGAKDLLIAISFGRCLQDTVDSVVCAKNNGVPTFGLTDSEQSPIARSCDHFWKASVASPSFHLSYVAPVAAINALLVCCAQLHPERSLASLQRKEQNFRQRWYTPKSPEKGVANRSKSE